MTNVRYASQVQCRCQKLLKNNLRFLFLFSRVEEKRPPTPMTTLILLIIILTRPKPAYGRQGLDWIVWPGYRFVVFSTMEPTKNHEKPWNHLEKPWKPTKKHEKPTQPTSMIKKCDVTDMGPNWPFRCLDLRHSYWFPKNLWIFAPLPPETPSLWGSTQRSFHNTRFHLN